MDWNLIRTFLAVVDEGSLSGGSEKLSISQPTVGRHINELESSLGLTLFVRGRSGMALSEAGLRLIDDARAMSQQAERLALKAAGSTDNIKGTIRITASEVVAAYILPPILCDLRNTEPDIEIELVANNHADNLLSRDADIAIRMFRPTQNELITRKVNEISVAAHSSEKYLDEFGYPKTMMDLTNHRLIGYDRDDLILQAMSAMGMPGSREMFSFRTDNQLVYWQLLKAGAGIGFCANHLAKELDEVELILPELKIPNLPMWLTTHQELRTNLRIRRCMDFLGEALGNLEL